MGGSALEIAMSVRSAARLVSLWVLAAFAVLGFVAVVPVAPGHGAAALQPLERPLAGTFSIPVFQFSPGTVTLGQGAQVTITFSGGTAPFYAWLNNTPPGCSSQPRPVVTSNTTSNFNCQPTGTGSFTVSLTVVDSSAPAQKAERSATLTVNPNGSSGGGSGGGGSGGGGTNGSGFSLPSGLLTTLTLVGLVVVGALVTIAAGTVATAVVVSRRLRQINETLARQGTHDSGKPPAS